MSFFDGENHQVYWLSDYVNYIESIIDNLRRTDINSIIVVGHSFGGRVGIRLAARGKIDKLLLIDSAGLKPRKSIKYLWRKIKYRTLKFFNIKLSKCGSSDYRALSPIMKKTFVNIVNTYQDHELRLINIPTFIIWGKNDNDTPIYMAKRFLRGISGSGLYIIKGAGHYSYIDNPKEYLNGLKEFIRQ